jgi:hypothetical protein
MLGNRRCDRACPFACPKASSQMGKLGCRSSRAQMPLALLGRSSARYPREHLVVAECERSMNSSSILASPLCASPGTSMPHCWNRFPHIAVRDSVSRLSGVHLNRCEVCREHHSGLSPTDARSVMHRIAGVGRSLPIWFAASPCRSGSSSPNGCDLKQRTSTLARWTPEGPGTSRSSSSTWQTPRAAVLHRRRLPRRL